jgi:hypothetical protein
MTIFLLGRFTTIPITEEIPTIKNINDNATILSFRIAAILYFPVKAFPIFILTNNLDKTPMVTI